MLQAGVHDMECPKQSSCACRLVQSGPYRYIRHPGYTGALISFTGALALLGLTPLSWAWWLIFAGPMTLFMVR
jgi:protein-S-isoprenylcysteine O-methyltransferase Ste14